MKMNNDIIWNKDFLGTWRSIENPSELWTFNSDGIFTTTIGLSGTCTCTTTMLYVKPHKGNSYEIHSIATDDEGYAHLQGMERNPNIEWGSPETKYINLINTQRRPTTGELGLVEHVVLHGILCHRQFKLPSWFYDLTKDELLDILTELTSKKIIDKIKWEVVKDGIYPLSHEIEKAIKKYQEKEY